MRKFKRIDDEEEKGYFSYLVRNNDEEEDKETLEYIKRFVYEKGGDCLKSEIIKGIMFNLVGIGQVDDDFSMKVLLTCIQSLKLG